MGKSCIDNLYLKPLSDVDYKTLDILFHTYEITALENEAIQSLDLFLSKHNIQSRHEH